MCKGSCLLYRSRTAGRAPVIYPIKAGGAGAADPDSEMLRYAELEFEARNVRLLTSNLNQGLNSYKQFHLIKDDYSDPAIAVPYLKTRALVGQIQNLKKVPSGATMSEKRISKHIQRDSWSALKYGLRLAQRLEYEEYKSNLTQDNGWASELARFQTPGIYAVSMPSRVDRMRGRRFC